MAQQQQQPPPPYTQQNYQPSNHQPNFTQLETQWRLKSTARNKADGGHCGGLFCILACQVPQLERCSSRDQILRSHQ
eukprot:10073570-Ditylum_brightwellii.AAC.1